jgi:predicted ABC-type ATPase
MLDRQFINTFLTTYDAAEVSKIKKDLTIVEKVTFDQATHSDKPVYLATAGAPGAGKSTTLEAYLQQNNLEHFVYVDPDQVSLKNMNFTYLNSLTNYNYALASSNLDALYKAYKKWRAASNYISHELMQAAFTPDEHAMRYSLAHGTTSTSPFLEPMYEKIKAAGYRIVLLMCYCNDDTRLKLNVSRETEQAFVKTTPEEVISKGVDFPKRFDLYFKYADEILFYWNNELAHQKLPSPCAKYQKTVEGVQLTILNDAEWKLFYCKYLQDVEEKRIELCKAFSSLLPKRLRGEVSVSLATYSFLRPSAGASSLETVALQTPKP